MTAAHLDDESMFGKETVLSVGNRVGCKFCLYNWDSFMIPNLIWNRNQSLDGLKFV